MQLKKKKKPKTYHKRKSCKYESKINFWILSHINASFLKD